MSSASRSDPQARAPEESRDPAKHATWHLARTIAIVLLALASIGYLLLALPAAFLTFVSFLSTPARVPRRRQLVWAHIIAGVLSAVTLTLFVVREAVPGMVAGGTRATGRSAVSQLREILFAQDAVRRHGLNDADGDGIGSALFIPQLAGVVDLPAGGPLSPTLLNYRYHEQVDTPQGPATPKGGFLYLVCLPKAGGGWTARPSDTVDAEAAERRWIAYAWPAAWTHGLHTAYFIDEHHRILMSDNGAPDGGEPDFAGPDHPPSCEEALDNPAWRPWRNKEARDSLPGDNQGPTP